MASPNSTFTEIVSTTLRAHKKEISDNVSNKNALMTRMKSKGKIRTEDGGYEIVCPLEYAENSTYQRYSGYDTLNVQASDVISASNWAWKQSAVHVTASGLELRQNMGEARMINLAKSRIKNAIRTFKNNLASDIYSDGSASNQISGLQAIVAETNTNTVGGISGNTYSFWRNVVQDPASPIQGGSAITASKTTIKSLMNPLWLELTRGNEAPDLIVASNEYFTYFWESLQDNQRYIQTDTDLAKAGFAALKYVTADVIADGGTNLGSGITATTMYFLNTEYLELVVHKDANMTEVPEMRSINQDAVVIPIIWQGNMACSNRQMQGVIK